MGPPKCGAPGNCPVCPPPLKPALGITIILRSVRASPIYDEPFVYYVFTTY